MDVYKWSSTAANNNSASPDGFPEGMAPAGVNNSARELMAAVKKGVIIPFLTNTAMRAITVQPETTDRFVRLDPSLTARFFYWKNPKSGADNSDTIIVPTLFSAGAFEEIPINSSISGTFVTFSANDATPDVSSGKNFLTANTVLTTITNFDGVTEGKEIWVIVNDNFTKFDFGGTNLKGNWGGAWRADVGDLLIGVLNPSGEWICHIQRTSTTNQNAVSATLASDAFSLSGMVKNGYANLSLVAESGTTDNLSTINNLVPGMICILKRAFSATTITVKHGTGNIRLAGGTDKTLTSFADMLVLTSPDGVTATQLAYSQNPSA